jgi:hypothetical protein
MEEPPRKKRATTAGVVVKEEEPEAELQSEAQRKRKVALKRSGSEPDDGERGKPATTRHPVGDATPVLHA